MTHIGEKARAAFEIINGRENKCALAEAQVSKELFERVKKEYEVAENAFVQGAEWRHRIDANKAADAFMRECKNSGWCKREWLCSGCPILERFKKAMEE